MEPKVSVVICIYNGEQYIPAMMDYLNKQTYRNIETVFVVSDRCKDNSLQVAKDSSSSLGDCKVILHENDKGLGDSKNCGIDNSTGDLLWFLDVDDIPSYHYLEYLIRAKTEKDTELVACNFVYSHNRDSIKEYPYVASAITAMTGKEAVNLRSMNEFPVGSWSMLYETKIVRDNNIRYPDGLAEDISFTYDYLMHVTKVCYYNIPLYNYYQATGSITNSQSGRDRRGTAEIATYNGLESRYSESLDRDVRKRFALMRLRSAGHMSYKGFVKYVKGEDAREMVSRNKFLPVCFEYSCISVFPTMYYIAIRTFFKAYFYNNGRPFKKFDEPSE